MYSLEKLGITAYQMLLDVKGKSLLMEIILEEFLNAVYDILAGKEPTLDSEIMKLIKRLLLHYEIKTQTHEEFYLIMKKCIELVENK